MYRQPCFVGCFPHAVGFGAALGRFLSDNTIALCTPKWKENYVVIMIFSSARLIIIHQTLPASSLKYSDQQPVDIINMSQQWKSGPPVQDVKVNTEKDLEFLWSGIARIAGEQRGNAAEFAKWDKVFKELPREVSNQAEDHFGRNKDNRDTNKKEIEAKGWTKQVEQAVSFFKIWESRMRTRD